LEVVTEYAIQGIGYINEILPYIPTKNQKELYYMPEFQENGGVWVWEGSE
jgi:hypothetical protein